MIGVKSTHSLCTLIIWSVASQITFNTILKNDQATPILKSIRNYITSSIMWLASNSPLFCIVRSFLGSPFCWTLGYLQLIALVLPIAAAKVTTRAVLEAEVWNELQWTEVQLSVGLAPSGGSEWRVYSLAFPSLQRAFHSARVTLPSLHFLLRGHSDCVIGLAWIIAISTSLP